MFGIDDAIIGSVAGSVIGGAFSSYGASSANKQAGQIAWENNKFAAQEAGSARDAAANMMNASMNFNADQAAQNRAFQERMRATQYQTATADMQAAGLNPMLAYSQGGAGTPTGAVGSSSAPSSAAASSTGVPAMRNRFEFASSTASQIADVSNKIKTGDLIQAQVENVKADTLKTYSSARNIDASTGKIGEEVRQIAQNIQNLQTANLTDQARGNLYRMQTELAEIEKGVKNSDIDLNQARTKVEKIRSRLMLLDIPGAMNEAGMQETSFGAAMPFINAILKSVTGAGSVLRMGR